MFILEFEEECERFGQKYLISFEEFEKSVLNAKDEKFEEWGDYIAWKFAEEGRKHRNKRSKKS